SARHDHFRHLRRDGDTPLHRPALVIHDAGIHDNTSPISVGTIPWEQGLGFYPTTFQTMGAKNDLVGVIWADEQQVWQRMSPGVRRLNRANIGFNVPPGAISADMLRPTGVELATLLLAQRRARRPDLPEAPGMPPTPPVN
ncbi:MAG TPA: hypothetical protein H9987_05210, partial [Candidatus Luteococcus avicola]|nr:hypothetical protein [Candidatus Luteococcus avicola]